MTSIPPTPLHSVHTPLHTTPLCMFIYSTLTLTLWKRFHSHRILPQNTSWPFISGASQSLHIYCPCLMHPPDTACILSPTHRFFHARVLPPCTIITHVTHFYTACDLLTFIQPSLRYYNPFCTSLSLPSHTHSTLITHSLNVYPTLH